MNIIVDGRGFEVEKNGTEWWIYEVGAAHPHLGTVENGVIVNQRMTDFAATKELIRKVCAAAGIPLNPPRS